MLREQTMKRDYYEVLGLKKGAADHEIKGAFRNSLKNSIPIEIREVPPPKSTSRK